MEFRFRAGDGRLPPPLPPPATSSDGYFANQALRAGFFGIGGGFGGDFPGGCPLPPPVLAMDSLHREIMKDRIRQDILNEMAQRRMLEEQVRQELEIERLVAMRMAHMERLHEPFVRLRDEPVVGVVSPLGGVVSPFLERFGERRPSDIHHESREALSLEPARGESHIDESSHSAMVKPSKQVSGTKRKTRSNEETKKGPKLTKDWSCAICQVRATNEDGLNAHLQGKRHKAKLDELGISKPGARPVTSSNSKAGAAGKDSASRLKTMNIQVDGKMHQVVQKAGLLWCERCKVTCNSTLMMSSHLSGKKHLLLAGESEGDHETSKGTRTSSKKGKAVKDLKREAAKKSNAVKLDTEVIGEEIDHAEKKRETLEQGEEKSTS